MDRITIDAYNSLAQEYDAETEPFWNLYPRTVIDTFARLTKGRVLDVGSGPGRDGLLLQEMGLSVVCVDASESMVELSRARGLESIQADLLALPFPDASFDGVWSYTSLLHVTKAQMPTALSETYRVLKDGGVLGLGLIEGDEEIYRESSGMKKPRLFAYYRREEVTDLLRKQGFTIEYFETFKPGSRNYLNFIARKGTLI